MGKVEFLRMVGRVIKGYSPEGKNLSQLHCLEITFLKEVILYAVE